MKTKISDTQLAGLPQTPVFPQTLHRLRPTPTDAAKSAKSPKRENTFSKSRDVREDRGTRAMKTTHNSQTVPHAK